MLQEFALVSGNKVNLRKLVSMRLNIASLAALQQVNKSRWFEVIKYLGINITMKYQDLVVANLLPLIGAIQHQLCQWTNLKLSWFGDNCHYKNENTAFVPKISFRISLKEG